MKKYTKSELDDILRLHRLWLDGEGEGQLVLPWSGLRGVLKL